MYTIYPTWAQAFKWALMRPDYPLFLFFSLVSFLAFAMILMGQIRGANWFPKMWADERYPFTAMFIFFALGTVFFLTTPINIKNNNGKVVPKEIYENQKPFWDSLANGHHLIDGPY